MSEERPRFSNVLTVCMYAGARWRVAAAAFGACNEWAPRRVWTRVASGSSR